MKILLTGITGQDAYFMAQLLLAKDYEVHGMMRRNRNNGERIDGVKYVEGDLTDFASLVNIVKNQYDEIYNFAAQSFVKLSWDQPELTANVTGLGVLRLLEAVRQNSPQTKVFQASSSEMFGNSPAPQNEQTPFQPKSPYGIAKLFAHWTAVNYRESYGMFVSTGISFNHESERRGEEFVTRKITKAIGRIKRGEQEYLDLGNLDAERDWGYAPDYMEAVHLIMQQDKPDDYVIATGEKHSVKEFMEKAFEAAELDWKKYVRINEAHKRPVEVNQLLGDASKIKALGWKPKTNFNEMIIKMVNNDL